MNGWCRLRGAYCSTLSACLKIIVAFWFNWTVVVTTHKCHKGRGRVTQTHKPQCTNLVMFFIFVTSVFISSLLSLPPFKGYDEDCSSWRMNKTFVVYGLKSHIFHISHTHCTLFHIWDECQFSEVESQTWRLLQLVVRSVVTHHTHQQHRKCFPLQGVWDTTGQAMSTFTAWHTVIYRDGSAQERRQEVWVSKDLSKETVHKGHTRVWLIYLTCLV